MKRRKGIFLFAVILFVCFISSLARAVNYPNYVGFVNDFAGIIDAQQERVLTEKLTNYERDTSIEIAVVTTGSLDGLDIEGWAIGLADKWEVGKEGQDNGVIIVVAPNERDCRIEVGRGLEGDLTDLMAGRIIDKEMIPYFKEGDFGGGVLAGVDAVVAQLGQYSAQERSIMAQKRAEEKRAAAEKFKENMTIFLTIVVIIAGLPFLALFVLVIGRKIQEARRKRFLRIFLHKEIAETEEKFEHIKNCVQKAVDNSNLFPIWAETESNSFLSELDSLISESQGEIKRVKEMIDDDPDEASQNLDGVEIIYNEALSVLAKLESLPSEIATFRENVGSAIEKLEKTLVGVEVDVKEFGQSGIEADLSSVKLLDLKTKVGALQNRLKKNGTGREDFSREIQREASDLTYLIIELSQALSEVKKKKAAVAEFLSRASRSASELKSGVVRHREVLDDIRRVNPESVWRSVASEFACADGLIASISIAIIAISAFELKKESEIISAIQKIAEVEKNHQEVVSLQKDVFDLDEKIKTAKANARSLLPSAARGVEEAEKMVKKSNVGSNAKLLARQAATGLEEAQQKINQQMIDWIGLVALIQAVIFNAKNASKKAKNNISEAESAHKIRKQQNSSSCHSSSSRLHSSSSPSSGIGFGGFGGGGFGGGGASGSW